MAKVNSRLQELGLYPQVEPDIVLWVKDLELPEYIHRVLKNRKIRTIDELISKSASKLVGGKLDECGVQTIVDVLAKHGLRLAEEKLTEQKQLELSDRIGRIGLPTKTVHLLRKSGICSVGDLLECSRWKLLSIEGMGKKSLQGIVDFLAEHGMSLAPNEHG